jgi:hypothetical protein
VNVNVDKSREQTRTREIDPFATIEVVANRSDLSVSDENVGTDLTIG